MHIKTEDYDDTEADHAYDLLSLAYFFSQTWSKEAAVRYEVSYSWYGWTLKGSTIVQKL